MKCSGMPGSGNSLTQKTVLIPGTQSGILCDIEKYATSNQATARLVVCCDAEGGKTIGLQKTCRVIL